MITICNVKDFAEISELECTLVGLAGCILLMSSV